MTKVGAADVVIIGGGPAGMSAAIWCGDLNLSALVVERESDIGGQLHRIHAPILNYLGVEAGNGVEMLRHFRRSIDACRTPIRLNAEVRSIDVSSGIVRIADDEEIRYGCLIVATGVRRRSLGLPGETEFRAKGVLESGMRDKELVHGKDVVIVGGGDAAAENAVILSRIARSVKIVHRRNELAARDEFKREIDSRENIEVLFDTEIREIIGDSNVTAVEVMDKSAGTSRVIPADAVLVRIGVEPNSELVRGAVEMDTAGYIIVDSNCETSVDGIFAVGDLANPVAPTLSTATGMGATAAKACAKRVR